MKKLSFVNLGCTKNLVDGESMAAFMVANGCEMTGDPAEAQIIVVNTCTFIKEATEEAIQTIVEMAAHKAGNCETLVVSGCFSQRHRSEASTKLPEVDLWVGVDSWREELGQFLGSSKKASSFQRVLSEPRHVQHLKISEGCSHRCTYCIIPSIRGNFHSRPVSEIIEEARWLYKEGVRELIIVSQDTSYYGRDIGTTLANLLNELIAKTKFSWIRMMYLHPSFVDDELLDVVAKNPRICPYFDIPLQHISSNILKAMKRKPDSKGTRNVVKKIRDKVPDAAIRTSFISGFPGETEVDHKELLGFIEESRFDRLGVFPFSPEDGTPAAKIHGRPRNATVTRRCSEIMELQSSISCSVAESRVGLHIPVIIDRVSDDPDYSYEARSRYDAPEVDGRVFIIDGEFDIGSIAEVEIVDAGDYDLFARAIS